MDGQAAHAEGILVPLEHLDRLDTASCFVLLAGPDICIDRFSEKGALYLIQRSRIPAGVAVVRGQSLQGVTVCGHHRWPREPRVMQDGFLAIRPEDEVLGESRSRHTRIAAFANRGVESGRRGHG